MCIYRVNLTLLCIVFGSDSFSVIVRRALASRLYPRALATDLGLLPVYTYIYIPPP